VKRRSKEGKGIDAILGRKQKLDKKWN